MFQKLPPIKYKLHPKMQEIMEQKRKRRQIMEQQRYKRLQEQQINRKQKKQYFSINQNNIKEKQQIIYNKKLSQRNKVRQQQKDRQARIQIKKAQRLAKLLPERAILIQQLKQSYLNYLTEKDTLKQLKIKEIIEKRLEETNKSYQQMVPIQIRIKQQNLIDINQGLCILCLTSQACVYMKNCRHLISCPQCQFMLRMQKKCPVCRKMGEYINLKQIKPKQKKRKSQK